jgi:hypothetical protein
MFYALLDVDRAIRLCGSLLASLAGQQRKDARSTAIALDRNIVSSPDKDGVRTYWAAMPNC